MKNVLVTGGAGFIGSNLSKKLIELDYNVVVLDNLSTGKKENLNPILDKIKFIHGDINDGGLLAREFKDIDYIFHHAAIPSVPRSIDNPFLSAYNNVDGTLNVLWAAKNAGVKKLVFAGSSSAYGNREGQTKSEILKPMPLSPYAATKLAGEYYCKVFAHVYGLPTICLRYFNVFGPNQNPDSQYSAVIPKFIKAIMNDESPVIYGDGTQKRDFTYVENNIKANLLAIEADKVIMGETINIACGKSYSLIDIVDIINRKLNKNIKPIFEEARLGEVKDSLADLQKAKNLIDYEPIIEFEEGLNKTIDWFIEDYKNDK